MNHTEFRAAVEKIIGVPPTVDEKGFAKWKIQVPGGMLRISHHESLQSARWKFPYFLALKFLYYFSPGLGEDPASGRWDIRDQYFNHDPEAVLRELVRRLARAGYEVPKGDPVSPEPVFHREVMSLPETEDREHIVQLNFAETEDLRKWMARPNGGFTASNRSTFEAVEGGGILVRTQPYRFPVPKPTKPPAGTPGWLPAMAHPGSGGPTWYEMLKGSPPVTWGKGTEQPAGLAITLTPDEQGHLAALLETAIEPVDNRPPGFVGSVWQGQQDAWNSILGKLKP